MSGEYRPIPPGGRDALPGHRDPSAYFYVGHGADCVLLCENGVAARWPDAVAFTPDEARRLGMRLMAQADAAEVVAERDRKDHHEDQHQRRSRTTHKGETHQ